MRFYSRFAERPFCVWADFQAIYRDGLDSFRMETIGDTYDCFDHASPKEAAMVAMDRLRLQQLLGSTDDRVMRYEHRYPNMSEDILGDIVYYEMTLEAELATESTPEEHAAIVNEQQYFNFLSWFVLVGQHTDPYEARWEQTKAMQPRWLVLALGSGLPEELILKVMKRPRLEDMLDAD
jgi:hypothetical protein